MTSPQDFKSLQDNVQAALVATVKSVNRVSAQDLPFLRAVDPSVGEDLDAKTTRILELSTTLLKSAADVCGLNAPDLEDTDDIDMRWRSIVDIVDSVLEKADTSIDEYTGALKRKDAPAADAAPQAKKPKTTGTVVRSANITKPQLHFAQLVDNNAPWKPVITKKPHAKVPLEESLVTVETDDGFVQYKHPYEAEIIEAKYPNRVYEQAEPIPWQPVETTEATFVDTYEGVLDMLEDLKKAKEIAVDLEHHDFRTYVGLTSLMQISTREKDWIVDTLKPWRGQLEVLNEVFADPSIIKVFHGAFMDMVWLQRDLGLYVNGLFDTGMACEVLHYPQKSLAFLLKKFVNFDADKKYQLADWRVRPLSEEMLYYARSDTHYLLYIYDKMRNELVMKSDRGNPGSDYIEAALQKSKTLSLSRYGGETFNPKTGKGSKGWYNTLLKHPMPFSGQQFAVYRAIWAWRDEVARREDESTPFVLPNGIIGDIAKHMPPDAKALHALIPNHAFLAKRNVTEIWKRYQEARERGVNEPRLLDFFKSELPKVAAKPLAEVASEDAVDAALEPVQLAQSQLFGGMPLSSAWEAVSSAANGLGEYVMLPWQKFVQDAKTVEVSAQEDVTMEGGIETEAEAAAAAAAAAAAQPEAPEPEEEFTLKTGTKRKAPVEDVSDGSDESDSDEGSIDIVLERPESEKKSGKKGKLSASERKAKVASTRADKITRYTEELEKAQAEVERLTKERANATQLEEAQGIAAEKQEKLERYRSALDNRKTRAERKKAKKAEKAKKEAEKEVKEAAKKAKKAAKKAAKEAKKVEEEAAAVDSSDNDEEEETFDYSKATSVLHANRTGNRGKAHVKPTFDPYSKTGNDPLKGARKAVPPRGERSATFKK
ncbi:Putative HRDC domain, 3'-5' exonuclease domain, HRDC-like superfamily, ribonuclease H superfamily [Colletotrichum destructivum]|uniref:HRDC domain, 3'-5' exonuclease domain, HRDC-like superfamily, ribonuclease H superfamily n=1 Tax=Colletotrichum destructivum TaxID=34406 RepID=A0AAX4I6A8_9PEZI|nr:Putative HRDC domain, 3'-5' exonuclease domain, HRDC-like superfamily, ribonuclease H superfamily [Colletotrichum destructivum]